MDETIFSIKQNIRFESQTYSTRHTTRHVVNLIGFMQFVLIKDDKIGFILKVIYDK